MPANGCRTYPCNYLIVTPGIAETSRATMPCSVHVEKGGSKVTTISLLQPMEVSPFAGMRKLTSNPQS